MKVVGVIKLQFVCLAGFTKVKVKVVGVRKLQFVCLARFTKVKVEEMKEKNLGCALLFCPTTPPSYTASAISCSY